MNLETIIQTEASQKEKNQVSYIHTYMLNLQKQKWYRWSYLQSRNRDTDRENKCLATKKERGGGMNWETWIDMYTHIGTLIKMDN